MEKRKARVLYIVQSYPQLSETYIETERREVGNLAKTSLFCLREPHCSTPEHLSYRIVSDKSKLSSRWNLWRVRPHVVHAHWMHMAKHARNAARAIDVPWTIRTHSFDLLRGPPESISKNIKFCNEEDCLAVLVFPFLRNVLLEVGLNEEKIIETMPVVNTSLFPFSEDHGSSIVNMGAALPKQNPEAYIELSKLRRDLNFNLYPMGSTEKIDGLRRLVKRLDGNVEVRDPVVFSRMPEVWKQHRWFVKTADKKLKTVGWPLSMVEAWASGTGVCVQRTRPDIQDYVGDAGVVFDDVEELADIIGEAPDPGMLERGRKRAAGMDVKNWIDPLFEAWRQGGVPI